MIHETSCGGILFRQQKEQLETLLIQQVAGHWGFPKGHVQGDECEEETALREIQEETGLIASLTLEPRFTSCYQPKAGVNKEVILFIGEACGGKLQRQEEEVQALTWLSIEEAKQRLSYPRDRQILEEASQIYLSKQSHS